MQMFVERRYIKHMKVKLEITFKTASYETQDIKIYTLLPCPALGL